MSEMSFCTDCGIKYKDQEFCEFCNRREKPACECPACIGCTDQCGHIYRCVKCQLWSENDVFDWDNSGECPAHFDD